MTFVEQMMRQAVAILVALVLGAVPAAAQRSVAAQAVNEWNDERTTRVIGAYDIPAGAEASGTIAVLNGPVTIAGTLRGSLVAINADVRLVSGARITGDVIVVGGSVQRADGVTVDGETRAQAELLRYTMDGERIEPEGFTPGDWRPRIGEGDVRRGSYTELFFVAARTYNRVEGLPVTIGPRFRRTTDWGRVDVEALGVARLVEPIRWDRGTIGHDARAEIRLGNAYGLVLGGRLFDVIDPIEDWQLRNAEAGLLAFVMRRDLRDHYGRHGAEGSIGGRIGEEVALNFAFGSERWRSVNVRNAMSLFNDRTPWRANPDVDIGTMDLMSVRLDIDTRERLRAPWLGGWYVAADIERGRGTLNRTLQPIFGYGPAATVEYTRGFIDARRYTNLSPGTQLNLRVVAAGQLGGNELPLQRKFSVGGPGSIEGYDFRRAPYDADVFTCGGIATMQGRATLCDRIALAQVELRQDFRVNWVRTDWNDDWWRPGFNGHGQWVLFADAGRGWTVSDGPPEARFDKGIPPLSSFRTSLGLGLDFGGLGVYLAKAVSTPEEKVNFLIRLGRRF
ncbi:MAG: hypothetical protein C0503_10250 [Gemmatimonas sp.]|nr:hypothetical protein [Gemmatimonas sp.]